MSDMKLFLQLGVKGEGGFKSAINGMANATSKSTKSMAASWASLDNRMTGVSSSIGKIAALLGGGALLRQAVVDVMNYERGLMEMRLTGELTAKELNNIRKEITALSAETLQLPEAQLEAFKDMVAAGIDPRQALAGLNAINRTATATFANVGDIGKMTVDLFQKMGIKPEKLERAFNITHKAGKSGRFELKDMARFFPEVLASASQYGVTGEKGVAQVAAMLQIARRNRGESSEAATDMKSFFSHIVSYRKQFKKVGLNVYDFIDLKSGKFKAGKDIDSFFEELRAKTKGGSAAMLKSIGIQDTESTNFMAGLMKDWADYKKIRDEALGSADQNVVGKDFDEVKTTTWAKAKRLEIERSNAMKSAGSSWMAEKTMGAGTWAIENPVAAGGVALGTYAGWKLLQRYLGGKGGKGGTMGGGFPGSAVPVNVTNFPAFLGGGTTPSIDRLTNKLPPVAPSLGGRVLAPLLSTIPMLMPPAMAYGSLEVGKYLAETEARSSSTQRLLDLRSRHMVMGGGMNSSQVRSIDQELAARGVDPQRSTPRVQNDIVLNLSIDQSGRVQSTVNNMDTRVRVGGNRGNVWSTLEKYNMLPSH